MRHVRRFLTTGIAFMPQSCKPCLYRLLLGYTVDRTARIGLSVIDVGSCSIGANVRIGHGNLIIGTRSVVIGDHVRIGHVNLLRGGEEIVIGRYAELLRRNELNSIRDAEVVNPADPSLAIGPGAVITDGHRIDFTDRVEIGRRVIIGGRNSSLWTHNRQRTAPIRVGELAYVGSEVRMTPGSAVPPRSIVGVGAVVVDDLTQHEATLLAGVPARVVKSLNEHDRYLVERKTRADLPDDV